MKFSWRHLMVFDQTANRYLSTNGKETKVKYAIGRVLAQIRAQGERLQNEMTDIEIDTCEVDDKGHILRDDKGNLVFTRDSIKERNRRQTEHANAAEIEIEPHFVEQLPEGLDALELAVFTNLIFRPTLVTDVTQSPETEGG